MLEYEEIEYGELLMRCAYGEVDADGHRFNVGNYVVVFRNAWGVVCIDAVCWTSIELRQRLLELSEEFCDCENNEKYSWDVYRVVPTKDVEE